MASFTDTQPPKFNPYIAQQPVEAMAQVGMQKQKSYEEGVQKIQTQIDNIAGLDVARDVDKAYLQSKLNQLGNRLRTVAAGDFSNFQLVNSVGGMTKQVIRDKGVQTAVASTAKMRKEQEFMEEERKKGDLNPANEYVFNKQLSSWFNNNDIHQGFNAKYNKFFDVDKFMRETFAAEKPSGFTVDQIFKTDGNGNPLKNPKTGNYELSTTMARLKKEGLFPEKVQQTIDHVFNDPRVSNQLQISGQYQYRGTAPEDLAARLILTKEKQVNGIDKNIMDLTMQKSMLEDGVAKAKIQNQIDGLVDTKNKSIDNYNSLITNIKDNADGVRGMLYKSEERNRFQDMFSYTTEERTVHENPAFTVKLKMEAEANEMRRHYDKMKMDERKMAQDERLAMMKMSNDFNIAQMKAEKDAKAEADTYTTADINTPAGIIDNFEKEGQASWDTYTRTTDNLLLQTNVLSKNYLDAIKKAYPSASDDEAMKIAVNAMAKKAGMSPAEFRAEQNKRITQLFNDNPSKLTPAMAQLKESAENAQKVHETYTLKKAAIDKLAPIKGLEAYRATEDLPDAYGPGGVVTRQDQMDIAIFANAYGQVSSTKEIQDKADAAEKRLNDRGYSRGTIDRILSRVKQTAAVGDPNDPKNSALFGFRKLLDTSSSSEFNSSVERRAAAIKDRTNYAPSVTKSLDTGEEKIDKGLRQSLKTYAGQYEASGQNESPGFKGNVAKIYKVLEDKDNGSVEMRADKSSVSGEIVHKAIFYDKDGDKVGEMTVTPDQASAVGFHPEVKYSTPEMRYVENKMAVTGNNSTAYGDVTDINTYKEYNDAAFTKANFPKLGGTATDVKGNIKAQEVVQADGSVLTQYFNYLYVNDNGFKFVKQLSSPKPSVEEAIQGFQNLNQSYLNTLISEQRKQHR